MHALWAFQFDFTLCSLAYRLPLSFEVMHELSEVYQRQFNFFTGIVLSFMHSILLRWINRLVFDFKDVYSNISQREMNKRRMPIVESIIQMKRNMYKQRSFMVIRDPVMLHQVMIRYRCWQSRSSMCCCCHHFDFHET